MDYQHFISTIRDSVASSVDEHIHIQMRTALKNNSKERVGLTFQEPRINLSPTIFLEEFYEHYLQGTPIDEITEHIIHVYNEIRWEHSWDVQSIRDFRCVQNKIVYKLINSQMNQEYLKQCPHLLILDLAIVFYVLFEVEETGLATIPITNELAQLWDTDLMTLKDLATSNTPHLLPPVIKPMCEIIEELSGQKSDVFTVENNIMFVLSNSSRSFGAACMLYEEVLDDIGNLFEENYYLLPSSVHEMILIPESQSPDKEQLESMVSEINETQLETEEILSEKVYYYDRELKLLS